MAVFQSSEVLEKLPAVFESACAEWHLQWGRSELRVVKRKCETPGHKAFSCRSVRPLPKWIPHLNLGIFASSILWWNFSPEATTVSEPKEHLAFPQRTSSSARHTDQTDPCNYLFSWNCGLSFQMLWQPGRCGTSHFALCSLSYFKVSNPIFYLQEWGKWNVQIEVEYNVGIKH